MPAFYDQFYLFGDSITQDSFNQERGFGFSAALQNAYIRRLNIVNRGLSGYNTRQALEVLPTILPSPDEARIRFFVVFFGANDASLPREQDNQHIPLEEYRENLEKIITHPLVKAHNARIILVAPPPVNEHLMWSREQVLGAKTVSRLAATTRDYALAAREIGQRLDVPVIDLWSAFMEKTAWKAAEWKNGEPIAGSLDIDQDPGLVELLFDGLHFNPTAYRIFFEQIMGLIEKKWPDQLPENLPMVLPAWNDSVGWKNFRSSK